MNFKKRRRDCWERRSDIIGSLKSPSPSQRHTGALWAQEAESRVDGFLAGKIKSVPGEQVLAYRGQR
jgi:hypothetical protein